MALWDSNIDEAPKGLSKKYFIRTPLHAIVLRISDVSWVIQHPAKDLFILQRRAKQLGRLVHMRATAASVFVVANEKFEGHLSRAES